MTNGKGSKRRPLRTTKAQFDYNWDKIYGTDFQNAEEERAQIDETIRQSREGGLTDEEIEAILDDRFGITETLEEYERD